MAKSLLEQKLKENNLHGKEGYFQNDEVYYYLGVVECELGNYKRGLDDFSHSEYISTRYEELISGAKKRFYTVLFDQGTAEFEKGNYNEALKLFQLSLKFKQDDEEALRNVARVKQIISENESNDEDRTEMTVITDSSVAFYSGAGIQNTKPFKCGSKWEIEWYHDGNIFQIFLYDMNGEMIEMLASENIPGRGSTFYPKKGEYYLKINAVGNWKINIMPVR